MALSHVLYIEPDALMRARIAFGLGCAGFHVKTLAACEEAPAMISAGPPDLLMFGVLPDPAPMLQLLSVMRSGRSTQELPVIAIDRIYAERVAVEFFKAGVDDYLDDSMSPHEFIARVRMVMRRAQRIDLSTPQELGGLVFSSEERRLSWESRSVILSPTEQRLMETFLTYPRHLLSREFLRFRVWGGEHTVDIRLVDVNVCRLRRSLVSLNCNLGLETVRAHGYRLVFLKSPGQPVEPASEDGKSRRGRRLHTGSMQRTLATRRQA